MHAEKYLRPKKFWSKILETKNLKQKIYNKKYETKNMKQKNIKKKIEIKNEKIDFFLPAPDAEAPTWDTNPKTPPIVPETPLGTKSRTIIPNKVLGP